MEKIKVFVVSGKLEINTTETTEKEWDEGFFLAKIGDQPIIVQCGGFTQFTTCAGFKTREEAEEFKKGVKKFKKEAQR